jgi:hypothetical protein
VLVDGVFGLGHGVVCFLRLAPSGVWRDATLKRHFLLLSSH